MLAIIHKVKRWRHYLKRATRVTRIIINHQNLKYFHKAKILNPRQVHWALKIQGIPYKIEYQFKKKNTVADILSQIKRKRNELKAKFILVVMLDAKKRSILWKHHNNKEVEHAEAAKIIRKIQTAEKA